MDNFSHIRDRGIYVATPMYGGQCVGSYTKSLTTLAQICGMNGIKFKTDFVANCSLIPLARNILVHNFLQTDYEHLLFWDADVAISTADVLGLMEIQAVDAIFSIIGAAYPVKTIRWDAISKAVKAGIADDELYKYQAGFPFNNLKDKEMQYNLPSEVKSIATGMMMIRRDALEKYINHYPDKVFALNPKEEKKIFAFFECGLNPQTQHFQPEDYTFCDNARAAGLKVWLCPWMHLKHTGTHVFEGSMTKISELGIDVNDWH